MNHRQFKKKMRDLSQPRIFIEGNKGGDFVEIIPLKNDRSYLHVGCSCVTVMEEIVPNEFLSNVLKDCIMEHGSAKGYLAQINYDEIYKQKLLGKVNKTSDEGK